MRLRRRRPASAAGRRRKNRPTPEPEEDEDERKRQVPVHRGFQPPRRRPRHDEPRLVAEPAEPGDPPPARTRVEPDGTRLRLRRGVQEARPRGPEEGPLRPDDRLEGVVAGRLGPLRGPLHPDDLAQRGHLPHLGRARRRRHRQPALRTGEQLARQRQPRQGAPPPLADQAEVRQPDLLGRPDDPRRQLRAGVDGVQDLRLRRRPRGHLAARGGHQLGSGEDLARRRALQRRARAREPARRSADGPHLREPRGAQRQPRPRGLGPRRARDLRPDGDERRGDRRPRRRRPHVRQGARRGRPEARRPGARGGPDRGAGPRLEERARDRQGRPHDDERHRGRVEAEPDEVGHGLLRHAVRLRVGAREEPRRRLAVAREGRQARAHDPRRPRPVEEAPADDDDGRPVAALRPGLRADLAPLPRGPGGPSPTRLPAPGSS